MIAAKRLRFHLPRVFPTWGADPEFFLRNGKELLPAFEFLPDKGGAALTRDSHRIYWDGFQAEWSYFGHEHFDCIQTHCAYQQYAMFDLLTAARKKYPESRLTLENVVRVPEKMLKDAEEPFVQLGCMPSMNAYNAKGKPVADGRTLKYRFAGGHIHFGYEDRDYCHEHASKFVKTLDKILGVWSVGAAKSFDNPLRRVYYGLAGEYRLPKHGFEYRTLSNFYYVHPGVFNLVHNIARACTKLTRSGHDNMWVSTDDMVQEAINNCDTKLAARILKLNKSMFMYLLKLEGFATPRRRAAYNVGMNGVEAVVKNPDNIETNWMLDRKVGGWPFESLDTWHTLTNKQQ